MTVKVALSSRRRGLLIFETAFANKGHAVATFYAGLYGLKSQMLSTGRASDVGNSSFNWRPQKIRRAIRFSKLNFTYEKCRGGAVMKEAAKRGGLNERLAEIQ